MQILLLSMPDSFEHTPTIAVRMPNGGLASLAGNVDTHHQVAIADLILAQSSVQATVVRLMEQLQPRLVGLSVMTFQRSTARRIISLIRSIKPDVLVAVGGYDPSLAPEAWTDPSLGVDFIVRGEGDLTFRELLRAIEGQGSLSNISGLWFRSPDGFQRNPARPATTLKDGEVRPPSRAARVLSGYTMMGRPIDVVETSRGCTFDCSFCSIIEMRGRNFHRFSDRSRDRGHQGRSRSWRAVDLPRGRQHHDRRPSTRGALPGHRRARPRRHHVRRAGDDSGDRHAWGVTGAADAPGGIPLRVPRHRERARRRSRVSEGHRQEQPEAAEHDTRGSERPAPARPARRRRTHRRQSRRYARPRSRPTSRSRGSTWTGHTSSTRRRIPARR